MVENRLWRYRQRGLFLSWAVCCGALLFCVRCRNYGLNLHTHSLLLRKIGATFQGKQAVSSCRFSLQLSLFSVTFPPSPGFAGWVLGSRSVPASVWIINGAHRKRDALPSGRHKPPALGAFVCLFPAVSRETGSAKRHFHKLNTRVLKCSNMPGMQPPFRPLLVGQTAETADKVPIPSLSWRSSYTQVLQTSFEMRSYLCQDHSVAQYLHCTGISVVLPPCCDRNAFTRTHVYF